MKYINYDVKGMAISLTAGEKTKLISGAVNYFGLHFNFDDEFSEIPGVKAVEFFKNKQTRRIDLVDGACAIPNELLTDKNNFEMRVISGNTIGTTWTSVGITESGVILPETPEEELPESMEYVKTYTGDQAAPILRASTNGLEYSQNGEDWNSGVSGVPEVPSRPKDSAYLRKNGDWVNAEEYLAENGGEANVIDEVKVNGAALQVENKSVNIDLSEYSKSADIANEYAAKATVDALQTMTGTASSIELLDYSETDTSTIVTKINEIIALLQSRGIATT